MEPRALPQPPEFYRRFLRHFIELNELKQLIDLLLKTSSREDHHSFCVDAFDLIEFDPCLAYTIFSNAKLLVPVFDDSLYEIQLIHSKNDSLLRKYGPKITVKNHCHIRIQSIPSVPRFSKASIGKIRSCDFQLLIQVFGTITRTGTIRMLEASKEYQCMNSKCGHRFRVEADPEQGYTLPQPRICPSSKGRENTDQNPNQRPHTCSSTNLRVVEGSRQLIDYQEIRIQDQVII